MKTRHADIKAFITKDGSLIRELMHPRQNTSRAQSLAEAIIPAASNTRLHRHQLSEEIYHVTSGRGQMTLGATTFDIETGDTVCIPPGTAHCLHNSGDQPLTVLCCCTPPYTDNDTEII